MSKKPRFNFRPNSRVAPAGETARDFLKSFGARRQVAEFLSFCGMVVSTKTIESWGESGTLPEQAYLALMEVRGEGLKRTRESSGDEIGSLEVYFLGKFLGRFELPRGVQVVTRTRGLK